MNTISRAVLGTGIGLAALSAPTAFSDSVSAAEEETRIKIASSSIRENGCSETYKTFKAVIPNPERLDRSYKGVLDSIEVAVREGNGTRGYSNFVFTDGGAAVSYQLYARGGGHRIQSPLGRGSVCVDASGANITIDVYAHYKQPTT
jgi:hypothetical protein